MKIVSNQDIGFATPDGLIFGTLVYQNSNDYDFKEKRQIFYVSSKVVDFIEYETNKFVVAIENQKLQIMDREKSVDDKVSIPICSYAIRIHFMKQLSKYEILVRDSHGFSLFNIN